MPEPVVGRISYESLCNYIKQTLGKGIFEVEITQDQVDNAILDALTLYSARRPLIGYKGITVSPNIRAYDINHDIGYGIFTVQFVQPDPQPSALFYANLLDVAPVKPATMESYDIFLRWRKTFMRITSVAPSWEYDEMNRKLMLYCPIDRTHASYFWHMPRTLCQVPIQHTLWVRKYATAVAKLALGKSRSKFQGILPGPARDLNLNGDALQAEANAEIPILEQQLLSIQGDIPPIIS